MCFKITINRAEWLQVSAQAIPWLPALAGGLPSRWFCWGIRQEELMLTGVTVTAFGVGGFPILLWKLWHTYSPGSLLLQCWRVTSPSCPGAREWGRELGFCLLLASRNCAVKCSRVKTGLKFQLPISSDCVVLAWVQKSQGEAKVPSIIYISARWHVTIGRAAPVSVNFPSLKTLCLK